jgi:hypothetical protein
VQEENAAPSRLHVKVAPLALEVNAKLAEVALVGPLGPKVIVVVGTEVSTTQVKESGLGSTLPAPSLARTLNVCEPSPSPE